MPGHDAASVSGVIPMSAHSHYWRLGFKQSSLGPIARVSRHVALDASRRPPLSWHALVPSRFRVQVSQVTQEHSSKFLPTASGIQRSASRRTPGMQLSLHPALQKSSRARGGATGSMTVYVLVVALLADHQGLTLAGYHGDEPVGSGLLTLLLEIPHGPNMVYIDVVR
jgi:hypothetical protein